jgi:protein-S-isoprenylcysteine O-methyltransferase Ste14
VLLTQGIYSRIRHPRYVETVLWVLGYALFTNYLALYLTFLFLLLIIHVIVLLEEKELKERFGPAYEEYCRRVPRYIPKDLFGRSQRSLTRFF